ncbi:hypothetical protein WBG78_06105 [Chryseolinea sp. T2]|uniref:hypothetical protein n=1 Tax=Chryseolinea sp. T2 TaxID=3129255 RepID=UPI003077045C
MKKTLLILLVGFTSVAYAQKIKLVEGDLSVLKDQKGVKTIFSYDDMSVGKFPKEADYVAKKKSDYNAKEAGTGDKWEKAWYDDRKERFEPKFRELFAEYSNMSTVAEDAPYTLIFKTTKTEPGWNVGVTRAPAYIDGEAWIVKSDSPDKAIAKITITKSPGRDAFGYDFETGARLQESYAKAGKELGSFIKKGAK